MNNGPGSLNRMYRLVWSEAVGGFVAVAENTSARGKRASTRTASTLLISAVLTGGAWAAGPPEPAAHALPTGGQVAAGQVRIDQSGSRMDVHQGTSRAIVNWQSFDIGAAAHVNFNQPNASAIALNRVLSANPSSIFGKLTANGQVMLINPNGIVFGASARVDVGGIAASTLQMADSDFLAGRFRFGRGDATGAVVNQGEIRAADGGYVALLAPEVRNEGVLQAHLGTVALAAGDAVSFDISGSGKLGVKVDPASVNALVENRHLIQADGGQVILSAGAAQRLAEQAIAMGDGAATALVHDNGTVRLVSAGGSVSAASGQVKIEGSLVDVSGAVSASGAAGGQVSVSADFVSQSGQLRAEGSTGRGGEVSVQAQDVIQTASAVLSADGANAGGRVAVLGGPAAGGEGQGQGVVYSSATLSARGTGQGAKGGQIDMSADSVQLRAALLDASGDAGGGKIRVGGGYQGLGADLGNARAVGVNGSTLLRADAIGTGDGGTVTVWSDDSTAFGGGIAARGGAEGGAGGFAEVSGKMSLAFDGQADLSAAKGAKGRLLLDPKNILIDDAATAIASLALDDPTPDGQAGFGSQVLTLANGNVVITAPNAKTGSVEKTGAVYLYDPRTGALLSQLRGSNAGDQVGNGSLLKLDNGNFVVRSTNWNSTTNGATYYSGAGGNYTLNENVAGASGALTWQSGTGTSGASAIVGAGNSLVGSTTLNDRVAGATVTNLTNGNLVFSLPNWNNGRGAVTWMDAATGRLADGSAGGQISAANSLVGSTAIRPSALQSNGIWITGLNTSRVTQYTYSGGAKNGTTEYPNAMGAGDEVGRGGITVLADGRYVVNSPSWSNGGTAYVGAVTYGAAGGTAGAVATGNSVHGTTAYDFVGANGVTAVGAADAKGVRSDYLIASSYWGGSGNFLQTNAKGAVTWVSGATGQARNAVGAGAAVSAANSFVGNAGDMLGALQAGTSYYYTTTVHQWYASGSSGFYSAVNSTGNTANRGIGNGNAITVLDNGNYVIGSTTSGGGKGSATFGEGATGVVGTLSSGNSLVGNGTGDAIGSGGIFRLSGGRYAVVSAGWDGAGATDAGAVTWGGVTGVSGVVSASNSLVGSGAYDRVGSGGLQGVGNKDANGLFENYIVLSPQWGSGAVLSTTAKGAVTWVDGGTGRATNQASTGVVLGSGNSLAGSTGGDYVGSFHASDYRSGGGSGNGVTPSVGAWNAQFSATVDVLANGNFVVRSPNWSSGKGAATWGSGTAGLAGTISASNSLVGTVSDVVSTVTGTHTAASDQTSRTFADSTAYLTQSGDYVGLQSLKLDNGNLVIASAFWGDGRGAVTWMDGSNGFLSGQSTLGGAVSSANSLIGSTPDTYVTDGQGRRKSISAVGDHVGATNIQARYAVPVISYLNGSPTTAVTTSRVVGPYQLGTTSDVGYGYQSGGSYVSVITGTNTNAAGAPALGLDKLSNGNVAVRSAGWNNGGAAAAGAITWLNGSTGALSTGASGGAVSAANSLVSDVANGRIGQTALTSLSNGNLVAVNAEWGQGKGAVTWLDGSTGQLSTGQAGGTIGVANSLVGSAVHGYTPATGWHLEPDGSWVDGPYQQSDNKGDRVGGNGITALSDGSFVVNSAAWGVNPSGSGAKGAVTWVNGANGALLTGATGGLVDAANSLVGATYGDTIGSSGVTKLDAGRYVVNSPNWSNGSATYAGAVTFGATGGVAGVVSASNSLVGSSTNDRVGGNGVTVLTDATGTFTNYLVRSAQWQTSQGTNSGAVTWVDGSTGRAYGMDTVGGAVSSANSLISGAGTGGSLGMNVQALSLNGVQTGDALVISDAWNCCGLQGAVTLISGATGLAGEVSWRNSLLGMQGTAANQGAGSSLNYTVLPTAGGSEETIHYRPMVWTVGGNSAAYVLSNVRENADQPLGAIGHSALSVAAGDGSKWRTAGFAGNAAGFSLLGGANGSMAFDALAGQNLVITPGQITSMLNAGTNVTLQATDDITVAKAVLADNPNGKGGDFTLQAGRSIRINADIRTDDGHFTAVANESGVMPQYCLTCTAEITMAKGVQIDTGTGNILLQLKQSTDKIVTQPRYGYHLDPATNTWLTGAYTVSLNANAAGDIVLGSLRGNTVQVQNDAGSIRTNLASEVVIESTAATVDASVALRARKHLALGSGTIDQTVRIDRADGASGDFDLRLHANLGDTSDGVTSQGAIRLSNVTAHTHGGDITAGGGTVAADGSADGQAWGASQTVNGLSMVSGIAVSGGSVLDAGSGKVSLRGATQQGNASQFVPATSTYDTVVSNGVSISGSAGQHARVDGATVRIDGRFVGRGNTGANGHGLSVKDADIGASTASEITLRGDETSTGASGRNAAMKLAGTTLGNASHTTAITLEAQGYDTTTVGGSSGSGTLGSIDVANDVVLQGAAGAKLTARASAAAVKAHFGGTSARSGFSAGAGDFWLAEANLSRLVAQANGFSDIVLGRTDQIGATSIGHIALATWRQASSQALPTLTLAAGTQLALSGANINVGAGTLVLDAQGQGATASSDNTTALTASQLLLKGQQASFDLSRGTHAIGTLAAQVGSLKLVNAGALNVGSVAGVHGITAAQGITLQAQGSTADLTLTQAVRNASGDMVLAAGRDFVNQNAPGTGLDAGIGRYLVYSSSPTGSTEGMTVEHKRYNQTYTAGVTPAYAASGNWFLYSVAPVITVSAGATTSIYGDAIGTIATPVFSGFIDGDTADTAGITGMVNLHVATGTLSSAGHRGVGTYATSLGSLSAMASALGYTFVAGGTSGTHTVTHKAVNPSGSRVYDGTTLVAAADLSVMAGILAQDAVTLSGEGSAAARDVGQNHAVALDTLALGGADGGNYVIDGAQLTITPRSVTVTAEDRSKVYGDADPSLGYQIGGLGLAAGDSQDSVFSGALSTVTGAAATAGTHAITQGDLALASGNYVLGGFADGTLTVDKAQLTLKADDQSKTFGTPTPALSYTVDASGLHYGDRADVVTGVSLSAPGVAQATVGTHAITVSGAVADNYEVTMQSGTLTVNAETVKSENLVTLVPVPTVIGSAVGPQVTARLDGGVIFVPPTAQPSLAVLPGSVSVVGGGLGVSAPALTPPAAAPVAAVDSLAPSAIATPAPAAPAPVMPLTSFTKPAGKAFSIQLSEIGLPRVDGAGGEGISVMARQADGRPLPSWLKFDPVTGTLSGTPPRGFTGKLELSFTTRDSKGQTSNQPLSLSFSG